MRRIGSAIWTLLLSRGFMAGAVAFIGISAVLGNVAQSIDRGRAEHDKTELQVQVDRARAETAEVKAELNAADEETKCRAKLAADAEVYSGQINVGIAQLVVAAQEHERDQIPQIITGLKDAAPKLTAALNARQDNVTSCKVPSP